MIGMLGPLGTPLSPWQVLQTSNLAPNSRCMLGSGAASAAFADVADAANAASAARTPETICVRMNFLPHFGIVRTIAHVTGRRGVLRQTTPSRFQSVEPPAQDVQPAFWAR